MNVVSAGLEEELAQIVITLYKVHPWKTVVSTVANLNNSAKCVICV